MKHLACVGLVVEVEESIGGELRARRPDGQRVAIPADDARLRDPVDRETAAALLERLGEPAGPSAEPGHMGHRRWLAAVQSGELAATVDAYREMLGRASAASFAERRLAHEARFLVLEELAFVLGVGVESLEAKCPPYG